MRSGPLDGADDVVPVASWAWPGVLGQVGVEGTERQDLAAEVDVLEVALIAVAVSVERTDLVVPGSAEVRVLVVGRIAAVVVAVSACDRDGPGGAAVVDIPVQSGDDGQDLRLHGLRAPGRLTRGIPRDPIHLGNEGLIGFCGAGVARRVGDPVTARIGDRVTEVDEASLGIAWQLDDAVR